MSRLLSSEWSVTAGASIGANIEALLADCLLFVRTLARRICRTESGYVLADRGRHYPAFDTQILTPEPTSNIVGMIPITKSPLHSRNLDFAVSCWMVGNPYLVALRQVARDSGRIPRGCQ